MHELLRDPFAHHVYQAFLNTLTGHPERNLAESATGKSRKRQQGLSDSSTTPPSFADLHHKFLGTLKGYDWSITEKLVFDKYSAPLLQSIIETDTPKAPKRKSKSKIPEKTFVDILLQGAGDSSGTVFVNAISRTAQQAFITRLLQDTIGSRTLETIIRLAPEDIVEKLFTVYFRPRLIEVSSDDVSYFCAQRILERLTRPEDVSAAVEDLLPCTEQFIRIH